MRITAGALPPWGPEPPAELVEELVKAGGDGGMDGELDNSLGVRLICSPQRPYHRLLNFWIFLLPPAAC